MAQRFSLVCFGLLVATVTIASCSSSDSPEGPISNGGSGGSSGEGGASGEGGNTGTGGDLKDVGVEEASPPDDVVSEPESGSGLCPAGSWGNVPDTKCHLIAQDCPLGQTCAGTVLNGTPQTRCVASNNGLLTRGESCTGDSQCAAGLKCVFDHCSPFCCKEAEFEICGPGGLCLVSYPVDKAGEYTVLTCSYLKPCTLWGHECPENEACHVMATDGSGACIPPSGSTFLKEGELCEFQNDCGDDQICIVPGAAPRCRYLCLRGQAPMDASADAGAGQGGCFPGQKCIAITDYPEWLGVCTGNAIDGG